MEFLSKFMDVPPEFYKRVRCRRIGLDVEWFSCVKGRHVFCGTGTYISNKNYRSNKEFDQFKAENPITRRVLVVTVPCVDIQYVATLFGENFLHQKFDYGDVDLVVFALNNSNFKVKKSKTFYVKSSMALVKDNNDHLLVDNLTFEMNCKLD